MKASDGFKSIIKNHLEGVAAKDSLFAVTFAKPAKNIDDCITYIMNTVKATGNSGFADDEIFGMAMHYYDEDDIKVGSKINAKVVVNRTSEAFRESAKSSEVVKPVRKIERKQIIVNQSSLF